MHDFHASLQAIFDGIKNIMESSKTCPYKWQVCVKPLNMHVTSHVTYHNGQHFKYKLLVFVVDRRYPNPNYKQRENFKAVDTTITNYTPWEMIEFC